MAMGYTRQIQERIDLAQEGAIFIHADFTDIAAAETVRRTVNRLVSENKIRRVLNGIYEKPRYSHILQEYVATDLHEVAKALARNYHWTISPSGSTALNLLVLSTQMSAAWSYRSDGPYKKYRIGLHTIEFRHRTNKEVSGLSETTALVVQALKEIGRDKVDACMIASLASRLGMGDKDRLLREAAESTDWVFDVIRIVCGILSPGPSAFTSRQSNASHPSHTHWQSQADPGSA